MTLACEYANSKLVEVVTVADVDDDVRVGNSLLQIWKLSFGHKAKAVLLKCRRHIEAEVWSEFCC